MQLDHLVTIEDIFDKFDESALHRMFAAWLLRGDDNTRAAQICATFTNETLNLQRRNGIKVADECYRTIDDFIPKFGKTRRRSGAMSWGQMKGNIGFK